MDTPKQNPSNEQLIKGCLDKKKHYQELLYNRFAPKMFGICLRYAKEYHHAQDILQEGFIKIFNNLHKFRGDGSFEGWIRRIFINASIEHYRKAVQMYPIVENDYQPFKVIEETVLQDLAAKDLLELVQQLAFGYRTVFNLYVIEGYSHKEIAATLGISEGTSKSQLARARYMLQKMIREQLESTYKENEQRIRKIR